MFGTTWQVFFCNKKKAKKTFSDNAIKNNFLVPMKNNGTRVK